MQDAARLPEPLAVAARHLSPRARHPRRHASKVSFPGPRYPVRRPPRARPRLGFGRRRGERERSAGREKRRTTRATARGGRRRAVSSPGEGRPLAGDTQVPPDGWGQPVSGSGRGGGLGLLLGCGPGSGLWAAEREDRKLGCGPVRVFFRVFSFFVLASYVL